MTIRPTQLLKILCCTLLLLGPIHAQTEGLDPRLTITATPEQYPSADAALLMDDIRFDVRPDRTHIFEEHDAVKVFTKEGVGDNDVLTRVLDESKAKIEVISARTIKPDGQILNAPPPDIEPLAKNSKAYSSIKRWSLSFPEVEEGDIVEFHIRTVKKPLPGGHFWATTYVQNPMPIVDSSFVVTVPKGVDFRFAAPGLNQGPKKESLTIDGTDYERLSWSIKNEKAYRFEALAPTTLSLLNRIEISSFKDWNEVAQFVGDDWAKKSLLSEGLSLRVAGWMPASGNTAERAQEVLKELAKERKAVGFLAEFPEFHTPDEVFGEKLVSSVDAALLASVALSAAGIPNIPVATLGVSVDSLADELPHPEKIQKIALRIPVSDTKTYWMDPDISGFLLLDPPPGTAGTAAVSWDPRWDNGLQNIAASSAFTNREELAVEGRLEATGRAELTVQFDRYGATALDARQAARDIKESGRGTRDRTLDTYFRNTARAYGQRARVLSQFFELNAETEDPFSLSYTLAVPNFGKTQGNTLMVPLPPFLSANVRTAARHPKRETPLKFEQPYQQDVRIHLMFPEGSKVDGAPATIERRTPEAEFVATGRAEGNEVWYVGRLTVLDPWVDSEGLTRTLGVLASAIESERTVVKVKLTPDPEPEPEPEVEVEVEAEPGTEGEDSEPDEGQSD